MKKKVSKLVALAMAAALILGGCGGGSTGTVSTEGEGGKDTQPASAGETSAAVQSSSDELTDLVISKLSTRELETFNWLHSQRGEDGENLTNMVDGLLEADNYGKLQPSIAESWGTEDNGLTWTFQIRDGVKWVDVKGNVMADCTAMDFATGLEFILNYHKNDSANTSMPMELIKGAAEYYEYTKSLSIEEGQALDLTKFFEMVGVEVTDDNKIIYTCVESKPYFDTVATYVCLYPAPQGLLDQLGIEGFQGMNNENMWYNGCYTMTTYIQGNEKIFTKNPHYWDKDCKLFDTVTIKMVESNDVAFQLYQTGELDCVDLTESNLKTIYDSPSNPYHDQLVEKRPTKYSYQIHFNFDKRFEDSSPDLNWNMAIANKAFRQVWYYGLDLGEYYKRTNAINPLKCENNFYTMKGLVYTSDGRDYTELVKDLLGLGDYNGDTMVRLDKEKAAELKKQAIEELTAKGVKFPVEADYYISGSNQTALDSATVLKQAFSDSFGDDFIVLNIKTYVSSQSKEVTKPRLQSFIFNGWGADYGDPQNYLAQELYGEDNAAYSTGSSNINDVADEELVGLYKEYTAMVKKADTICDDFDARYQAYAEAEAFMIQNAFVIPCNYNITWTLTHINEYSKINLMYGFQNEKIKNWETSKEAYTTEQYEAIQEAFEKHTAE